MIAARTPYADTQRVLGAIALGTPRAAARADRALRRLLRDVEGSPCPEYAWTASGLTGDGYPVEFTFTSRDELVRYTVAPWPEEAPRARLALACERIGELGGEPVPDHVAGALARLSDGLDEPAGGAWIAGRHAENESLRDRFKLYVPTVSDAQPEPGLALDHGPVLQERAVQLRLYGYEPAGDIHERYFRVRRLLAHHVGPLLRGAGLEHRTHELLDLVQGSYGHPIGDGIPGGSVGFSLAGPLGGPTVFTLYLFARALWGGDRRIRRGIARLAVERGWQASAYRRASAPLADRDIYTTYHAMAGFVVDRDGPIQFAIGLRPPPLHACA